MESLRRVYFGWWIVFGSTALGSMFGAFYMFGFSAFILPLEQAFNANRTQISLAIGLASILQGFVIGPSVGILVDRFGPRLVTFTGATMFGLGYVLIATASSLIPFYAYFLVFIGIGSVMGTVWPQQAAVAAWFIRRRSLAFGLQTSGFSIGAMLVILVNLLIETVGWRWAAGFIGITIWSVALPTSLLMRRSPERYGLLPDGDKPKDEGSNEMVAETAEPTSEVQLTLSESTRTKAFWLVFGSLGLRMLLSAGTTVHLIPTVVEKEFSSAAAGVLFVIFGATGIPIRLVSGLLGDRYNKVRMYVLSIGMMGVAAVILAISTEYWHLLLFILVFSTGHGATGTLMAPIVGDFFGRKAFASIWGFGSVMTVAGMFGGPFIAGFAFDRTGNYDTAQLSFAGVALLAAAAMFVAQRPYKTSTTLTAP